jgi:hypothetical protein
VAAAVFCLREKLVSVKEERNSIFSEVTQTNEKRQSISAPAEKVENWQQLDSRQVLKQQQ